MFETSTNYENAPKETISVKDIKYSSKFPDNILDLIYPKNYKAITLVIFLFMEGDKSDITGYAIELVARSYTVVNTNYALAFKGAYPKIVT